MLYVHFSSHDSVATPLHAAGSISRGVWCDHIATFMTSEKMLHRRSGQFTIMEICTALDVVYDVRLIV